MGFPYKCILLIGATSGIGAGFADTFVNQGSKVIAAGRRQDRLDDFVKKHGQEKASQVRFDITNQPEMDNFVSRVVNAHPELDCVFLNAGIQSAIDLSCPESIDLDVFHREIDINFTSIVNLSVKFLPHLMKKSYPTSMIITSTHLATVPAATMPAYSSSKAALKAYFDCLRRQNEGSNVQFIEICPPLVQTELHDYMGQARGRAMGMPLNKFIDEAYVELKQNKESIVIGVPGPANRNEYLQLLRIRQSIFEKLSNVLMAHFRAGWPDSTLYQDDE